jgi:hypothetical protein
MYYVLIFNINSGRIFDIKTATEKRKAEDIVLYWASVLDSSLNKKYKVVLTEKTA